jgi:hypothetical protein
MILGNLPHGCKVRSKDPPIEEASKNTARLGSGNPEATLSFNEQA